MHVAQCDYVAGCSDDLMFVKVRCCLRFFLLSLLHIWYRMINSPLFSQYPTARTSSLYVFLDVASRKFFQPHLALGYCEDVVG
jgi:hypothetical protein